MAYIEVAYSSGGLTDSGANLIATYNQQSMNWAVIRELTVGSYCEVWINDNSAYKLIPFKTSSDITSDYWFIDLADVLPYVIALPPEWTPTNVMLTTLASIAIKLYTSAGVLIETFLDNVELSYGVNQIGESGVLVPVFYNGARDVIYHNGIIGFYWNQPTGTYELGFAGATPAEDIKGMFNLAHGYNTINILGGDMEKNGVFRQFPASNFSLYVVFKPSRYAYESVMWINRDGAYSLWNFKKTNTEIDAKLSKQIPIYGKRQSNVKSPAINSKVERTRKLTLEGFAVDSAHYEQLIYIATLGFCFYAGYRWRASSPSKLLSCKQNLKFILTLERDEYAVSY